MGKALEVGYLPFVKPMMERGYWWNCGIGWLDG